VLASVGLLANHKKQPRETKPAICGAKDGPAKIAGEETATEKPGAIEALCAKTGYASTEAEEAKRGEQEAQTHQPQRVKRANAPVCLMRPPLRYVASRDREITHKNSTHKPVKT